MPVSEGVVRAAWEKRWAQIEDHFEAEIEGFVADNVSDFAAREPMRKHIRWFRDFAMQITLEMVITAVAAADPE